MSVCEISRNENNDSVLLERLLEISKSDLSLQAGKVLLKNGNNG